MKTAISIPDALHESIEVFLKARKMSRSEFFQRAARVYLRRASSRAITANLDRVYSDEESPTDVAFRRAAVSRFRDLLYDEEQ